MPKTKINRTQFIPIRDPFIIKECRGKVVLHIGACDWPHAEQKLKEGRLLYALIDKVAKEQVGIDLDKESIEFLNDQNFQHSKIIYYDMNKVAELDINPDIIIFGETVEHLMNVQIGFTNLKKIMTPKTNLIISTPNAFSFLNFYYALFGIERQHPDHKIAFTHSTLKQMLIANGFEVKEFLFTFLPRDLSKLNWKGKFMHYFVQFLAKHFPLLAPTILVNVVIQQNKEND